jgi:hypothetical protein
MGDERTRVTAAAPLRVTDTQGDGHFASHGRRTHKTTVAAPIFGRHQVSDASSLSGSIFYKCQNIF